MSLDRIITLSAVGPLRRLLPSHRPKIGPVRTLPILMYHSISDISEKGIPAYFRTVTSAQRFAEQMGWLAQKGFRGVTLKEGLEYLAGGATALVPPVAITFDDGFQDFYSSAFPLLQRQRFTATMYLSTAFIGDTRLPFKSRSCLNWQEVRELQKAGIEFGSHSVNHPELYKLSKADVEFELAASKGTIEDKLGLEIASFAYPYAFPQGDDSFLSSFTDLLQRFRYHNCVTTVVGRAHSDSSLYSLVRLPVNGSDDQRLFDAKLDGAYDWVGIPQKILKTARRASRFLSQRPS